MNIEKGIILTELENNNINIHKDNINNIYKLNYKNKTLSVVIKNNYSNKKMPMPHFLNSIDLIKDIKHPILYFTDASLNMDHINYINKSHIKNTTFINKEMSTNDILNKIKNTLIY